MKTLFAVLFLAGCTYPTYTTVEQAKAATDPIVADAGTAEVQSSVVADAGASNVDADAGATEFAEPCDKTESVYNDAATYIYAEHAYPGETVERLGNVFARCVLMPDSGTVYTPPGYTGLNMTVWVKDGFAVSFCGTANAPECASVVFYRL